MSENRTHRIENYGKQSVFASFLPGIAGLKGIPIWCYYVNRGQGVVSFGVDNKDHAIQEFYPAHVAYQNVKRTGFRTFFRRADGHFFEAFRNEDEPHHMEIGKNTLTVVEENQTEQITTRATYFVLPNEPLAALVRSVTVRNDSGEARTIDLLDGMPALIPYGVDQEGLKNMTQTAKAWMQVEDEETFVPYYRVRASMEDSAAVTEVLGGNFAAAFSADGQTLPITVDPAAVFSYDNSLDRPVVFEKEGLAGVRERPEHTTNLVPCAFAGVTLTLPPHGEETVCELIGQVENKEVLHAFLQKQHDAEYFAAKQAEAVALTEELTDVIETRTADPIFDEYCRYTYMDNVLRGGAPIRLGNNKIFYVYSRKHGDLERDYNYFSMLPEYFSQGNGNFRDVNQNRRCDVFFHPFVGRENLHMFYGLIQPDGYNPLGIEKLTYTLDCEKAEALCEEVPEAQRDALCDFVEQPYTPGALYRKLEEVLPAGWNESIFYHILDFSDQTVNGDFLEGYWSDHWTYNLDLILDYLEVYPEAEEEMLYEEAYPWFVPQAKINPREKRYEKTEQGLRQYHAIDKSAEQKAEGKLLRADYGAGEEIKSTLAEKLLLLCAIKTATLDSFGMGIEMEGGKPGWYDALNGLPGLFGSSMAETYELSRMLTQTIAMLTRFPRELSLLAEIASFVTDLGKITEEAKDPYDFWDRANARKEAYRDVIWNGVSGEKKRMDAATALHILTALKSRVDRGIKAAEAYAKGGVVPTYFYYEAETYEETADGLLPTKFAVRTVPSFLEGPVRYLKCDLTPEEKEALYQAVRDPKNALYDEKLSMYRVNESLLSASYELGRARAFTPGWLEHGSIWLHMEYKYLLELLRSKMYTEFFADFRAAAVPFLDEATYGRSVLENSSFLASSLNPDPSIHGKGFVARLSGSTIEFLSIWKLLFFGPSVFTAAEGELRFTPQPTLPEYLVPGDGIVEATLFGTTRVCYHFPKRKDYFAGQYRIKKIALTYGNGSSAEAATPYVSGRTAEDIRNGKVSTITVTIEEKEGL